MKKSYLLACEEAKNMSLKFPDEAYYVFKAMRKPCCVHSQSFINCKTFLYELYKDGYAPAVKYINGVEKRA